MARQRRYQRSLSHNRRIHLGYSEVKLPNGKWVGEHRVKYQEYWGVTLDGTHYVTFANGDRTDLSRENLILRNKELDRIIKETGKIPKEMREAYRKPAIPTSGIRRPR